MTLPPPPAYAWDWFARQRLLWRESRSRLARSDSGVAARYRVLSTRSEVVAALRDDYVIDPAVRATVDEVVREVAFLDRTDASFAAVASPTAPRGLRWWWSHLTGEQIEGARRLPPRSAIPQTQLTIDEVLTGYGDDRSPSSSANRLPGSSGS